MDVIRTYCLFISQVCLLSSKCTEVDVLQKPQVQLRLKTIRYVLCPSWGPIWFTTSAVNNCLARGHGFKSVPGHILKDAHSDGCVWVLFILENCYTVNCVSWTALKSQMFPKESKVFKHFIFTDSWLLKLFYFLDYNIEEWFVYTWIVWCSFASPYYNVCSLD